MTLISKGMLIPHRVGDIVDIKANGAVQKGSVPIPNPTNRCRKSGRTLETIEGDAARIHSNFKQHATQGLPRKDRCRLQCNKECRWCYRLQEGQAPVHREASQPESRTRFPVPIKRRIRPPRQEQCRAEEEVKGGGHTCSLEETTCHAARIKNNLDEGQCTGDCRSNRLRDNHLSFRFGSCLGFFAG
jgi:hypothetical protein